jgi:glycosyltransferase involved in cell wall biosynthesis
VARFNVITNWTNGVGLQRDAEMLRAELERRGHTVHAIPHKEPTPAAADVNVFLEVVVDSLFLCAPKQWAIPNPEWWFKGWPLDVWDLVLTKTQDARRIFTSMVGDRCQYLGWQANDFYDPAIPRETRFLHVRGKSQAKNTDAVRDGARRAGVALTVLDNRERRVTDEELRQLLNSHAFCLLPSAYEGYGHSLHEAMGCGQIVITTNAPPMNELQPALFVRPSEHRTHHCGVLHAVQGRHVAQTIARALALTDAERAEMSRQARATFEGERAQFQANLNRVLETHL